MLVGIMFQKDLILLTNQFQVSVNLVVNVNVYNSNFMFPLAFLMEFV